MQNQFDKEILQRLKEATAVSLWKFGVVKTGLKEPFKLASGNFSPIYINCRQVISNPTFMNLFITTARLLLEESEANPDMVAGGETAGIPYASYIAQGLTKPMLYVRKMKKGYGLANLVEGGEVDGKNVLLVEDLITDGGSKLHFIDALREAGATVDNCLVLFDRLQGGEDLMKEHGVKLFSVVDMKSTMDMAELLNIHNPDEIETIKSYFNDPEAWHDKMGLDFNK